MDQLHRDCKWSSKANIQCDDGRVRSIAWQKCRKEDARMYIQQYKTPQREGNEIEEEAEPPAQTEQAEPPLQEEQPQWPQEGDDTAAGPSSTQAPAATEEAQQSVPQQHTDYSGGGGTVPGPTAPPQGQTSMSFEAYAQATRYYQPTLYAGQHGGQSSAGEYASGYDMPIPEDMSYGENMPFDEYYGGGEDSFYGMPMGSGGGPRAPSTVAAPVEARAEWVATSPENLYHSDETDGVVKDQPYTALPPLWSQPH